MHSTYINTSYDKWLEELHRKQEGNGHRRKISDITARGYYIKGFTVDQAIAQEHVAEELGDVDIL